jgi:hypothetical protein
MRGAAMHSDHHERSGLSTARGRPHIVTMHKNRHERSGVAVA